MTMWVFFILKFNKMTNFRCDAHVESLSQITREQASAILTVYPYEHDAIIPATMKHFKEPVSGVCVINYPLSNPTELTVSNVSHVGELLWDVAKKYKEIYDEPTDKYGIWGHGIGDLFIEGVSFGSDGSISLSMGS